MKNIKYIILGLLLSSIASCSTPTSPSELYKAKSEQSIYRTANEYLAANNYTEAAKAYEALDSLYPFGVYTEKSQLEMMYAYYQVEDYPSAVAAANRYIHLYPRGTHTDYAYYIKGLSELEQDHVWFLRYFPIDLSQRDLTNSRHAFQDFNMIVTRFPNSRYAPDAYRRMVYLRNLYAQAEVNTAAYYLRRHAYVAAANRATYVIQHYSSTPYAKDALVILEKTNRELKLNVAADEAAQVIKAN